MEFLFFRRKQNVDHISQLFKTVQSQIHKIGYKTHALTELGGLVGFSVNMAG